MPDLTTLALFAAACVALAATPGPDMLLIATRSASHGRRAGFLTLAGIQVGTYCHALAAALGLSQLFVAVPMAYDAVRYAGAAYLLFLAWQAVRADGRIAAPAGDTTPQSDFALFRQGLITNVLNPKMALFVLALFPQFVTPDIGSVVAQMMILATVLNLIGLAVNGGVIVAASQLRGALTRSSRYARLPHILLGTVFAGLALRLALDQRR
jgi:threonine/homoserine/homoserine lactone efflux protein